MRLNVNGKAETVDDALAAHALSSGCSLVTNDQALRRVAGLVVVDWSKA